jgi:hypothetical protein
MPRLCSESSRPYPGRSARNAVSPAMGAGLRPRPKDLDWPPDPKAERAAPLGAIPEGVRLILRYKLGKMTVDEKCPEMLPAIA